MSGHFNYLDQTSLLLLEYTVSRKFKSHCPKSSLKGAQACSPLISDKRLLHHIVRAHNASPYFCMLKHFLFEGSFSYTMIINAWNEKAEIENRMKIQWLPEHGHVRND